MIHIIYYIFLIYNYDYDNIRYINKYYYLYYIIRMNKYYLIYIIFHVLFIYQFMVHIFILHLLITLYNLNNYYFKYLKH